MSFGDLGRVVRAAKLARRKPRIFGPSLVGPPLVIAPVFLAMVAGRKAGLVAAVAGLLLVMLYAVVALHPLVRFLPPLPADLPLRERVLKTIVRRPLGMMLVVGAGVAVWLIACGILLNEWREMLSRPWIWSWVIGMFGTLVGIAWWEIAYGKDARRARDRSAESPNASRRRGAKN